jgi:two-component system, NtrC family, response regulator HydG
MKNNYNIVIIDDEIILCEILDMFLSSEGYAVKSFYNSNSAYEHITNNNEIPDLVIIDYNIPEFSGIDILKKLKIKYSDIKIVMMSGSADKQIMLECYKHGVETFIKKPFKPEQIIKVIEEILVSKSKNLVEYLT